MNTIKAYAIQSARIRLHDSDAAGLVSRSPVLEGVCAADRDGLRAIRLSAAERGAGCGASNGGCPLTHPAWYVLKAPFCRFPPSVDLPRRARQRVRDQKRRHRLGQKKCVTESFREPNHAL
jgi:hypothetical protein